MEIEGSLALVAELAIGLVGFASLVAVVGHTLGRDALETDRGRLRGMLEGGLFVLGFALIPQIPYQAGVAEETVWRACAGTFAVAAAGYAIYNILRVRRLPSWSIRDPWHLFWISLSCSVVIVLGAASFGMLLPPTAAYLWGLYAYLAIAALTFLRLVRSLLERPG
jgi:hypothetical protein